MPSIQLKTTSKSHHYLGTPGCNPLPTLLQTPSGLAILEIQGTINSPTPSLGDSTAETTEATPVGRLEFPLSNPLQDDGEGKWMKKVYFYVGKHQRLTGEVRRLARPLAVIRKVDAVHGRNADGDGDRDVGQDQSQLDETLEIIDVVKFKLLFSGRPEPVGGE